MLAVLTKSSGDQTPEHPYSDSDGQYQGPVLSEVTGEAPTVTHSWVVLTEWKLKPSMFQTLAESWG